MAKKYDHRTLAEAIRQGQARMKEKMGANCQVPEPPHHEARMPLERPKAQTGKMMSPRPKPRIKPEFKKIAIIGGVICIAAIVIWFSGRRAVQTPSPGPVDKGTAAIVNPSKARAETASARREPVIERVPTAPPVKVEVPEAARIVPSPQGDHVIVIATYVKREHLEPVQEYFKGKGVETEIMRRGSYYLLVTKDRFASTERIGADGYEMKQKIKSIGLNYKAPSGYENFGRTPFQDVYGMKITTD